MDKCISKFVSNNSNENENKFDQLRKDRNKFDSLNKKDSIHMNTNLSNDPNKNFMQVVNQLKLSNSIDQPIINKSDPNS